MATTGAEPAPLRFRHERELSAEVRAGVGELVSRAAAADGAGPLDDQVRSEIAHGTCADARHVLATDDDGTLVAYAHIDVGPSSASAHLVVDPPRRRQGFGHAALVHLLAMAEAHPSAGDPVGPLPHGSHRRLLVWAHGDLPGAVALAASRSFARVRDLWQMRRSLAEPLPEPAYPDDVRVRTFEPGEDDAAWVRVNAAAFASHPEQGRLTTDDLHHRMEEEWFDASGFFLVERAGELLGSHWTKVHREVRPPVGEVYAVGVSPTAQGLGLGRALTLTGLRHLRDAGLGEVMLYVDGDNAAAVRLYESLGFERTAVDVMYASP